MPLGSLIYIKKVLGCFYSWCLHRKHLWLICRMHFQKFTYCFWRTKIFEKRLHCVTKLCLTRDKATSAIFSFQIFTLWSLLIAKIKKTYGKLTKAASSFAYFINLTVLELLGFFCFCIASSENHFFLKQKSNYPFSKRLDPVIFFKIRSHGNTFVREPRCCCK